VPCYLQVFENLSLVGSGPLLFNAFSHWFVRLLETILSTYVPMWVSSFVIKDHPEFEEQDDYIKYAKFKQVLDAPKRFRCLFGDLIFLCLAPFAGLKLFVKSQFN
jgi:hypothetical protein